MRTGSDTSSMWGCSCTYLGRDCFGTRKSTAVSSVGLMRVPVYVEEAPMGLVGNHRLSEGSVHAHPCTACCMRVHATTRPWDPALHLHAAQLLACFQANDRHCQDPNCARLPSCNSRCQPKDVVNSTPLHSVPSYPSYSDTCKESCRQGWRCATDLGMLHRQNKVVGSKARPVQ